MKRFFALALAALMLCGCTPEPPEPTTVTEPTEAPTEEIVISHDAVETLEFDCGDVFAIAPMGDDLLLLSGMDQTTLTKISGRNHKELATASAGISISPNGPGVQISGNGVCYATETEYVFLDENLEETQRITLPDAWGRGVVTADLRTIYYSTGSELRVYNRETGLDRLLRETTHTALAVESLELNDSVLVCSLPDYSAVSPTHFYSTATGELLGTYHNSISLDSAEELWLAKASDGRLNQIVFGGSAESRVLTGWESFSDVTPVRGGILIKTTAENTSAIRFLNLSDNTEAVMALDEDAFVTNAWNADGILWIALDDGRLLRWELDEYQTQDAACFAPYYSRENPDTEGLAALEPVIRDMEDTYGVKIHILEDAVALQPAGQTLECAYQVDLLTAGLEALDGTLAGFTPEFLANASKASADSKIHIALVRSVSGEGCIQFLTEDGNARIVLAVDETLQQNFYHGLAHIIDIRVMTECSAFDNWKRLNPKDFDYDYDYAANSGRDGSAYADAFIDTFAMSFPTEDRARIFEYAMLPDSDSRFASDTMQKKLQTLCSGIRKAFDLRDSEEAFPWEQYLSE